ncbi:MAG: FAD-dependent thymidylate synthase [Bacteroidetes bacterium]|nr:FAD-dependent thymidylate synthase [Bacteroidota bacterium]
MTEKFERIERINVPELNDILGKQFKVLDDGFVRVVDYMGSDNAIVQAARVSYGSGTKQVSEDRGLIRYLLRNKHTSPFEMCEIKFHVRVPMDIWRQWIRHRTANVNEYSTRYSIAIDSANKTLPGEWRLQSQDNKQGSEGFADPEIGAELTREEEKFHTYAREMYDSRLEKGIARELARKDLPLSTYTEAYWKLDLHNLLHFLRLRIHPHAQYEIREYAKVIGDEILKLWCPITWEAFNDYLNNSMSLSAFEIELISYITKGDKENLLTKAGSMKWLDKKADGSLKRNRERDEFEDKLKHFGMDIPW